MHGRPGVPLLAAGTGRRAACRPEPVAATPTRPPGMVYGQHGVVQHASDPVLARTLRHRLRWRRDEVVATLATNDPAVVARAFAYLFGLGALLVACAPGLPGAQVRHEGLVWAAVVIAVAVSATVISLYDRTPDRVLRCLPAVGTVLVTLVLLGAREVAIGPFSLLYFWVVLSAFYFFGRQSGLGHLAFVVGSFAVVLVVTHVPQPAMWALLSVSTLSVTGLML